MVLVFKASFICSGWVISTTHSSSFLTCSSGSSNILLILISVTLISAVPFFSSGWFFVVFSQFHWTSHFTSVSHSVVSDSLRPHGQRHPKLPCPSATPGVYSNSCPLNRRCYPTISSCAIPFSSCLQSFPASGSFPMSQLFTWGGQCIGVSASASVLEGLISFWMDWLDLLTVQGTLKSLLQQHSSKASKLWCSSFFIVQLSHPYMTTGKKK